MIIEARRTLIFQEFLQRARDANNVTDWPLGSAQTHWFGMYSSGDQQIPTVVPAVDEIH